MNIFQPLQELVNRLTIDVLRLTAGAVLEKAVNFFIFDTVKIFLLLAVIIFLVSLLRSFLPPEKTRLFLSRRKTYLGNILAALIGIVTPFCSCSAIPLFLGFVQAGVPLGVTFSFLVSSPMVNEVALIMLLGMFGWKIALIYVVSGLIIAVVSGLVLGRLKLEGLLTFSLAGIGSHTCSCGVEPTRRERLQYAGAYTRDIIKHVWLYVLLGIGVGAWIHGYVPTGFLAKYAGAGKWYGVPLAVLIGIPLYANAAGVIPLVGALTEKGVSMGTTLSFMMAVTGLSLPEFLILKKVMRAKLILIFAGIVGAGIIFTGYLFNWILG